MSDALIQIEKYISRIWFFHSPKSTFDVLMVLLTVTMRCRRKTMEDPS
jgi:hypothetical protein